MQYPSPICFSCKHIKRATSGQPLIDDQEGIFICTAYPEGIPEEIIESEVDHKKPYEGDNGIQYEPVD